MEQSGSADGRRCRVAHWWCRVASRRWRAARPECVASWCGEPGPEPEQPASTASDSDEAKRGEPAGLSMRRRRRPLISAPRRHVPIQKRCAVGTAQGVPLSSMRWRMSAACFLRCDDLNACRECPTFCGADKDQELSPHAMVSVRHRLPSRDEPRRQGLCTKKEAARRRPLDSIPLSCVCLPTQVPIIERSIPRHSKGVSLSPREALGPPSLPSASLAFT